MMNGSKCHYYLTMNLLWLFHIPVCGGDIRDETSGTVSSPGWPGNYPNNRTCVWTIRVPAGSNIHVHFAGIDLEAHANCSFDYLEVMRFSKHVYSVRVPIG